MMIYKLQRAEYRVRKKEWKTIATFDTFDAAEEHLMNLPYRERVVYDWRIYEDFEERRAM